MQMYIHAYIHTHTCIRTHIHIHTYVRTYIHKGDDPSLETVAHEYMCGQMIGFGGQPGECIHRQKGRPQPWDRTTGIHGFISCMHTYIHVITETHETTRNHHETSYETTRFLLTTLRNHFSVKKMFLVSINNICRIHWFQGKCGKNRVVS